MGLHELIDYLVRLKLANNAKALCILEMAANGESPRRIYEACDATRYEFKHYLSKAREKMGDGFKTFIIIKHVLPLLDNIQPIIINNRCIICNTSIYYADALNHLHYKHRDIVEKHINKIIEKLVKRIARN